MHITKIEGIGPVNAARLQEQGITSTEALLEAAASKPGRKQLSQASGLSDNLILEWVNRADLMRVRGVGEEYSDLLEAAGVDTVKELRRRNAENLHETLVRVNDEKRLCRRVPSLSEVERWLADAKELEAVVTY
jgi:predicted flap endonuclease-1-like 5' DNA nuclease